MNCGAILLAAGSSSRMGRSKQLLDINGEKLLVKTIQTVIRARIPAVTVVLGAEEQAHRNAIQHLPVDIVVNQHWKRGMGSSLKSGLTHLLSKNPTLPAVIVLVCDQPLLKQENISALVSKYGETKKPLIASRYKQMPGVPALFDSRYFEQLAKLPDDEGAKKILLQNRGDVIHVDFPGGEVDLDTREDYEAFIRQDSEL